MLMDTPWLATICPWREMPDAADIGSLLYLALTPQGEPTARPFSALSQYIVFS